MVDLNYEKLKETYKKMIAKHLAERCQTDTYLAEAIQKPGKTLDGVIEYVKSQARKKAVGNVACIPDDEVYSWAVHYILEDSLDNESGKSKVEDDIPAKVSEPARTLKKSAKTIAEELQPLLFG